MKCNIIAEVGCNHGGDIDYVIEVIDRVKDFAWAVKLQKRWPGRFKEMTWPHPDPKNAYGNTYGEHRKKLELPIKDHKTIAKYCEDVGVVYSTSVWDRPSAGEIVKEINPGYMKISRRALMPGIGGDPYLAEFVKKKIKYRGRLHISKEASDIDAVDRYADVSYLTVSKYPTSTEDARGDIKSQYYSNPAGVKGYSAHHLSLQLSMYARCLLPIEYIEHHVTLDREAKGTDQCFSLYPEELRQLTKKIEKEEVW